MTAPTTPPGAHLPDHPEFLWRTPEPKKSYDVVIVGGGHNGLVCAGYLAGAGLSVCVVERSPILGGPAGKREFLPGYFTTYSNSPGSFEPKIAQELELQRHGLQFKPQDPTLVHPFDDGRLFVAWRDRKRTAEQFESFAPDEATRRSEEHTSELQSH